MNNLYGQYQLPGYRLFTEPQVLQDGHGVGLLVSSGGITNADTVFYLHLGPNGQLRQKERIDSLPSGIRDCRSLSGPNGSYLSIIQGPGVSPYILKAQPRNRIGLPARKTLSENLQVSPIPATNLLQLNIDPTQQQGRYPYQIHDLTGQLYQRGHINFTRGKATLDISHLPPGSYILLLEKGTEPYRAQFVVQR